MWQWILRITFDVSGTFSRTYRIRSAINGERVHWQLTAKYWEREFDRAFVFDDPVNPGDVLRFDPNRIEFADYNEDDPRSALGPFLLNFSPAGDPDAAETADDRFDEDAIFGDLGNDWLVGGPDNDNLYAVLQPIFEVLPCLRRSARLSGEPLAFLRRSAPLSPPFFSFTFL